jgi:hypothetical protein
MPDEARAKSRVEVVSAPRFVLMAAERLHPRFAIEETAALSKRRLRRVFQWAVEKIFDDLSADRLGFLPLDTIEVYECLRRELDSATIRKVCLT